jgi:5-methylcytosine-specific restriction endonuclease McrA
MTDTNKHSSQVEYNDDNPWRDESTLRELYFGEKMTLSEIAERFEISHQSVIYWFDKHGIQRRSISDYWERDDLENPVKNKSQLIFCSNCSGTFKVRLGNIGDRKYCSQKCAKDGYNKSEYAKTIVTCVECGSQFKGYPHRKYCSHSCYADSLYNGGNTLNELYRKKERANGWIESVFERDEYVCQRCGSEGGRLQAHHVVPVSKIVEEIESRKSITDHELFNDTSNGQTLCVDCHDKIHYGDK